MLTGRLKSVADFETGDARRFLTRFSAENFTGNLNLGEDLTAFANRKNCSPGQLTLAWLLAKERCFPFQGQRALRIWSRILELWS